jgi:hypothetical protein
VYFLERGDAPIARDGLALVVRRLAAAAVRTDEGTTWLTTPAMLPSDYAAAWPEGFYDCGVAHGTPGVLALLAHVPEARPLCAEAIRWVLAQRQPDGRFPTRVAPARPRDRARAAWCYGEPGIATALWSASARLGTPAAHAREIALDAARREAASCGVRDAKLCHGAAGLAHLFNRLYQASGEAELGAAARAWFARTLERRPSAGFDAPIGDFLEGEIGIALALLAAVTPVEPRWDRLLLCDVPPA